MADVQVRDRATERYAAGSEDPTHRLEDADRTLMWRDYLTMKEIVLEVEVWIEPDETGVYCARLPQLPGVVGDGATIEAALDDVGAALLAARDAYLDAGVEIPWLRDDETRVPTAGTLRRWLTIHA